MNQTETAEAARFWSPDFVYDHRPDGAVLMRQARDLPPYPPVLADFIDRWAEDAPDRAWIRRRTEDGEWRGFSYGEARAMARSIGAGLLSLGLGPERPLLVLSGNSLEHALLSIACAYVGVPYSPVSPAYSLLSKDHSKLRNIVQTLNPGAVFAEDGMAFGPALATISKTEQMVIGLHDAPPDAVPFETLTGFDPTPADEARATLTPHTVVKYLFTSGSTGSPKAVINTNRMICAMHAMVRDCYRFLYWQPPIVLDWAPWNHTAGGNKVFYMVLTNGGTFYIDDGRPIHGKFDETLRNLREIACTWYFNVPIGWDMLVEELEKDPALTQTFFSKLNMLFYAGAGLSQLTWDRLSAIGKQVTGRDTLIATGLGSTETAPFALCCTEHQDKAGNVGVPAAGLTMKLVPSGGKLEVRLKGPSITPGYHGDPETTAQAFDSEGFYRMGDAVRPADPEDFSKGFFFDGRVAENFKLSTGTWVAVGAVRSSLVDSMGGLVRDAVIVGENEPELGALLLLSPAAEAMDPVSLRAALADHIKSAAREATGSAARVRRAVVLPRAPDFDRGEITEKGSLNQRALRAGCADLIAALYAGGEDIIAV